jgi:hypothetical protein
MDDQDRWEPYGDPLGLPMVDEPAEPDEIGRLYGPDGEVAVRADPAAPVRFHRIAHSFTAARR